MRKLVITTAVLSILPVLVSLVAEAETKVGTDLPTVDEVIERYIEALGGREAIERLKTRICTGHTITDLPTWDPPVYENYPIVVTAEAPGKSLLVEYKTGGIHMDGTDGSISWRRNAGGIERRQERFPSKLNLLFDPQGTLRITEHFPGLSVTGVEPVGGAPSYVVEPAGMEKAYTALYFDTNTGMLVQMGYYYTLDYREVDGVLVPFRISMSRKGGSTTIEFDEIVHNIPVDEALFAMPSSESLPKTREYVHPSQNIRFEAPRNWLDVRHPGDDGIYEVVDPEKIVHVVLRYTETEMSCERYLTKMANMKELSFTGKPERRIIGGTDACTLKAKGSFDGKPARFHLVAFQADGKLYIVQAWCPEEQYFRHIMRIEEIINSLEFANEN